MQSKHLPSPLTSQPSESSQTLNLPVRHAVSGHRKTFPHILSVEILVVFLSSVLQEVLTSGEINTYWAWGDVFKKGKRELLVLLLFMWIFNHFRLHLYAHISTFPDTPY